MKKKVITRDPSSKPAPKKSAKAVISQQSSKTVRRVLTGGLVSSDFIFRHKLKLFAALVLLIFYISTKYDCMTGMETIRSLEHQLEVVKTESVRERSTYMSRIRESSMAAIADSIRPGLSVRQQPPYILHLDNK